MILLIILAIVGLAAFGIGLIGLAFTIEFLRFACRRHEFEASTSKALDNYINCLRDIRDWNDRQDRVLNDHQQILASIDEDEDDDEDAEESEDDFGTFHGGRGEDVNLN